MNLKFSPVGPEWHDSPQKYELDATLARDLRHPLLFLSRMAYQSRPLGYGLLSQEREGMDGELFSLVHLQTMVTKNVDIRHSKDTSTPWLVCKQQRHLAVDSLLEILNVSTDPNKPKDMSVIGVRPQLPTQINLIEKMCEETPKDKALFNTWDLIRRKMRPGLWSAASAVSDTHPSNTIEFHRACMESDIGYYYHGSAELDLKILFATLTVGQRRANELLTAPSPVPTE